MATKKEILDQIAAMQAEADAMGDGDDEYEVEIWDKEGNGARVPRSAAKSFLNKFGIDLDLPADPPEGGGDPKSSSKAKTPLAGTARQGTAGKYFGKRPASTA